VRVANVGRLLLAGVIATDPTSVCLYSATYGRSIACSVWVPCRSTSTGPEASPEFCYWTVIFVIVFVNTEFWGSLPL